jgi:RNA polymerase sigma-70 factor (ECF subfamily)
MNPDQMLQDARREGAAVLGPLLEGYRNYLRVLARVQIGRRLQGKLDASDLVQDTLLDAHRQFGSFQGKDEHQLVRWLKQILAGKVADVVRRYFGTKGRDVRLEQDLVLDLEHSSQALGHDLAASVSSPSQKAVRREQGVLLADALEELPDDYRDVLIFRHIEGLTFSEVARRMQRSQDSVEKLWLRALAQLRRVFAPPSHGSS